MPTSFTSWNSFSAFARAVRFDSRFIHDEHVQSFLKAVSDSTAKHCITMNAGAALWRAQNGHDWRPKSQDDHTWEEPWPLEAERMKPLRHSAHEGRVNPKGIPCLYAAGDHETAIAEVRPWLDALVSVAQMRVTRDLRIVNCSDGHDTDLDICFDEPAEEDREPYVWRHIGRAFSDPITLDPALAEYVPTQVLAEHFRKQNYDGVAYKSKLGKGYNFALFDLDALDIVDVRLYPVRAVRYEIGDIQASYKVAQKPR